MQGQERYYPIDCEIGDYVVIEDVRGSFGRQTAPGVFQIRVEGPTGKQWVFERQCKDSPAGDSAPHRWVRIE